MAILYFLRYHMGLGPRMDLEMSTDKSPGLFNTARALPGSKYFNRAARYFRRSPFFTCLCPPLHRPGPPSGAVLPGGPADTSHGLIGRYCRVWYARDTPSRTLIYRPGDILGVGQRQVPVHAGGINGIAATWRRPSACALTGSRLCASGGVPSGTPAAQMRVALAYGYPRTYAHVDSSGADSAA